MLIYLLFGLFSFVTDIIVICGLQTYLFNDIKINCTFENYSIYLYHH